MHFIEQFFGISPDGGSGILELSFLLGAGLALGVCYWIRKRPSAARRRQ